MSKGLIHTFTIKHPTGTVRDSEGKWVEQYSERTVSGRLGSPSANDTAIANSIGERVDAMGILLYPDTPIEREDHIVVSDTGKMNLDGDYSVVGFRPNPLHQRLMLRRWEV